MTDLVKIDDEVISCEDFIKLLKFSGTFDGLAEGHTFTNFLGSGLDAELTYAGGTLFFDAYHDTLGWELSKSDGTGAGTRGERAFEGGGYWVPRSSRGMTVG